MKCLRHEQGAEFDANAQAWIARYSQTSFVRICEVEAATGAPNALDKSGSWGQLIAVHDLLRSY
jgi:hypothetical protein